MNRSTLILRLLSCLAFIFAAISCDDNDSFHKKDIVQLSTKEITARVDAEFSVEVSLANREAIHSILVKKTRSGQTAADFTTVTLDVENTVFPYTFTDVVKIEDEEGIPVYSFYGLDADGNQVDATDLLLKVELVDLKRLLKFDWLQKSYTENGTEMINGSYAEFADDIYRFNDDYSWECDWGTNAFLSTLVSYCAWKYIGTAESIDSIYTIKYGLSPSWTWEKEITKYDVVQFGKKELTLKTTNAAGVEVKEVFSAVVKSSSFTPYRGANAAGYYVADCNPGSY